MPYNGDPASEAPGYAIEIARAIFEHQGVTIDYQTMPWGDALKAAAAGKIEAVVGANKDEGAGLVLPNEYIGLPRIGLFVQKQNAWRYDNVPSLHNVRLAVMQDYKYWPAFDEYLEKHSEPAVRRFTGAHPLDDAMARLLAGEIDVLAETTSVFVWVAKTANRPMTEFRIAYLHEGDPVFMAFAPGDTGQRYASLYDEGLRELRRSGELAKILARYGQKDWQP
jgi:polar amino acid transport system substrate-binding protein